MVEIDLGRFGWPTVHSGLLLVPKAARINIFSLGHRPIQSPCRPSFDLLTRPAGTRSGVNNARDPTPGTPYQVLKYLYVVRKPVPVMRLRARGRSRAVQLLP